MTRMMDNYFWPTARAKNFLKKLNERGYTETKPTNYEANIQALASQVNVPSSRKWEAFGFLLLIVFVAWALMVVFHRINHQRK